MTKWKPVKRMPMLSNGPRAQMGQVQVAAAAVPILIRFGLPFVAWAGGAYLASLLVSKAVPDVPINKKNLGIASALIGAGVTSYFISETLSTHWKPAAYAGAVAGIAAGLYFLLQEAPPAPPPSPTGGNLLPPTVPKDEEVPKDPRGILENKLVVQLDSRQDRAGGTVRNMLIDQPFAFSVRNQDRETRSFYAGLEIQDTDGHIVFKSKSDPSEVGMKLMTVSAGGVKSEDLLSNPINFWFPQTVTVLVNLYRNRDDATPFISSAPISIKMVYPGGGFLGAPQREPVRFDFHNDRDPNHVIGCAKCKKKKTPFSIGPIVYNP